jgi:Ser/Thr protein kinase RdoA (MazF antagonist)
MHQLSFQPDKFTDPSPKFTEATPVGTDHVCQVLEQYQPRVGALSEVHQIGGVSVEKTGLIQANASIFLLSTAEGEFILKRNLRSDIVESLASQLKLLDWLGIQDLPVPTLVKTTNGDLATLFDGDWWYMTSFIFGDYFSGRELEIEEVGSDLGRFLSVLSSRPEELTLNRRRPEFFTPVEHRIFSKTEDARGDWSSVFGSANAEALDSGWQMLSSNFGELVNKSNYFKTFGIHTSHLDLHPHNVLIGDNSLAAVLDFDACYEIPLELSVGFATAKLMKRVGTRLRQEDSLDRLVDQTGLFLSGLARSIPAVASDRAALKLFAKAETMRRFLSMCNRHFEGQKSVWNDIPVHLAGLLEIEEMF